MSWADLDKLAVVPARPGRATTLVARDERPRDQILGSRHLSILVAIGRVTRGQRAIAEKLGGTGSVVYATSCVPPDFLVDAVTAAGGVVFDGTTEHTARSPLPVTVQLDAAFCDLASTVRRRLGAKTFDAALDQHERDVQRARFDVDTRWTAVIELVALTGELIRERRAAKWIAAPDQRLPFALDLGGASLMVPGSLAQTIVDGGAGSMRDLLQLAVPSAATSAAMPLLCDRRSVPIEKLTWERLVDEQVDTEDVPVIVYVEDRGGTIHWPFGPAAPAPDRRARALANLAKEPVEIQPFELPGASQVALVTGGFYAAESLLVPATMERVRRAIGGPRLMLVAVPERGHLIAIDGERAMLDDDLQHAFVSVVEKRYGDALERHRISKEVLVYTDRPIGRLEAGQRGTS